VQQTYPVTCDGLAATGELCSLSDDQIEGMDFTYFNFIFAQSAAQPPQLTGIRAQFAAAEFLRIRRYMVRRYGPPKQVARQRLDVGSPRRLTVSALHWTWPGGAQVTLEEVVKLSSSGAMDGELRISAPRSRRFPGQP